MRPNAARGVPHHQGLARCAAAREVPPARLLLAGSARPGGGEPHRPQPEARAAAVAVFRDAGHASVGRRSDAAPDHLRRHFAPQLRAFLMQRLNFGSYPEVVTSDNPTQLLRELSSDYLWKDVLQTGLVKTPDLIKRLLLLLAHQAGSEVSVNELATQLQMARPTVERYLDLLEQTFVIFRLPSFSTNPRKEITKSRKVFFWDTGIRNALLSAFSTDEFRPDIGALWENWVIAEVAKHNALLGSPAELFFWRTRAQSEVDLVVKQAAACGPLKSNGLLAACRAGPSATPMAWRSNRSGRRTLLPRTFSFRGQHRRTSGFEPSKPLHFGCCFRGLILPHNMRLIERLFTAQIEIFSL